MMIFTKDKSKTVIRPDKDSIEYDGIRLTKYELLAAALLTDDKKDAWDIMRGASIAFHPLDDWVFNELYVAVGKTLTLDHQKPNEFAYQSYFRKQYSKFYNGEIATKGYPTDRHHQPDAWVLKDGEYIPVEVKLNTFNKQALKQLKRYMKVFHCQHGIACAKSLTTKIPNNIQFISFEDLGETK